MKDAELKVLCVEQNVIFDVKNILPLDLVDARL